MKEEVETKKRYGGETVRTIREKNSKHQSDVLGVYRMVDSYNDRPVYKQDGGENYIYYRYFYFITPDQLIGDKMLSKCVLSLF